MDLSSTVATQGRNWLAALLRGDSVATLESPLDAVELLACADAEGVVALAAERLGVLPQAHPARMAFALAAKRAAAVALLRDAECQRVLAVLAEAATPALLLKGSALAWWLYPSPFLRECSDIDLLLASRAAVETAAGRFSARGYDRGYTQGDQAYELVCRRELSGSMKIDLDLHWGLNNAPVFSRVFDFEELHAASIPLPSLAPTARGLSPPHALLHACMHRAINLYTGVGDSLKWLYDLHLLAGRLAPSEWELVLRLCRERGLGGVCVAGLDAAAEAFGPAAPIDSISALRAIPVGQGVDGRRLQDWRYMHGMNLKALPTWNARLAWILRKLVPTVAHMREMYGANKGLVGLLMARVRELARKAR